MKVYRTDEIRNVVLLGHGGCGKTSLVEAMAYVSGATNRMGKITDGNTISDFDKEEQKREFSISTALVPIEWEKAKINVLDTPGYFDFVGEVEEAVSAADAAVIVVSFIFSAVFLFYTNSFLMKRRTKEIGLYNILGMEKKHISLMMLFENVIITIISLTAGIVFGIIFSRLMFLVLMKLIKADSVPAFVISTNAVVVTIIYFISIFAVIFIYNFVKVQMSKPIELLHSDEIGEKEPKTKLIMTILGLLCLGGGYYFALTVSSILKAVQYFFVAALFVVIGTYLLFTAGSIALLKLLRKNKRFYYKTGHFTAVSGMLYRMKQNAIGLANICVLSTIVLIAVASTVSLYAGMQDSLNTAYPSEQNIVIYGTDASVLDETKNRIYDCIDAHNAAIKKDYSYKAISIQ